MGRLRLRAFEPQDVPEVAALQARVNPHYRWPSDAARAAYLREILLDNPWCDPELPSWVAEDGEGIVGFLGVIARRMRFGARPIRVAVSCQLMVDPARRTSLAALELMRRFFLGPQDLSVADGPNDAARRCWEAAGGIASPLHSLHWVRLLSPAQGALQLAASWPRLRTMTRLAAPFAALADACGLRISPAASQGSLREEAIDAESLATAIEHHRAAYVLRPHYDAATLEWLLGQVRAKRRYGLMQGCLLRDSGGRVAGWFLYYLNRRMSQVLQVGAQRERVGATLECLFEHARSRGAVALQGRLEPHLANGLQGKQCLLQQRGAGMLLHARDSSLLLPFFRGDALFTRLDGEWWTRFSGDDAPPADEARVSKSRKEKLRPLLAG
jgi:hypothetical protein